jgi:hypothetical protein
VTNLTAQQRPGGRSLRYRAPRTNSRRHRKKERDNSRPPWALRLPFNSGDIGTNRWQLDQSYNSLRAFERG